jgi:GntR family transcriptional regulator
VDSAEEALRNWLAPGRHRTGDRLPPEHDLAAMLGVSRGTLRTALQRLEESGEIVRRQGSGTFVGNVATPTAFVEGLERLEPYSMLARRRGVELGVRDVQIDQRPIGAEVGSLFGLAPETQVAHVSRVVLAGGEPAAYMTDVVHPDIALPGEAALRRAFERGEMILDVLLAQGVPIAFATTRVMPRLLTPGERVGRLFGVRRTTAALELEEIIHVTSGEVVHHSRDLFGPGGMDLHVVRGLDVERPAAVNQTAREGGGGAARASRLRRPREHRSAPSAG